MVSPKVFISYSHDSLKHKEWVLRLATDLRNNGVDASLDQWDLAPGQDIAAFMQRGIAEADRVLMICTQEYVSKADAGLGGVGYERLIVTAEVVQNIDTKKFIPLVRNNNVEPKVPRFLGPRVYIDFNEDISYEEKREKILRELLGVPALRKPALGKNPFSSLPPAEQSSPRQVGPTGVVGGGTRVLDDDWFNRELVIAQKGINALGLEGQMELRFGLHEGISKSQIELLRGVEKSEIRTFGWPIGVTLGNRDEYRPRPYGDGIRAEVALKDDILADRPSYDYWALRANGDFFLLQGLFEDQRAENAIFFNTRIVRVTEALLFADNLYGNLGVAPDSLLSVRVAHRGLAGRQLTSAGLNRFIFPTKTLEDQSQAEIVVTIGKIRDALVSNVRRILEPMFMLFDFSEFSQEVYEDIVRRFERGEVT